MFYKEFLLEDEPFFWVLTEKSNKERKAERAMLLTENEPKLVVSDKRETNTVKQVPKKGSYHCSGASVGGAYELCHNSQRISIRCSMIIPRLLFVSPLNDSFPLKTVY